MIEVMEKKKKTIMVPKQFFYLWVRLMYRLMYVFREYINHLFLKIFYMELKKLSKKKVK